MSSLVSDKIILPFYTKNNIDNEYSMCYDCIRELSHAAVAQSVVRRIGSAEVAGPIPASSCLKALDFQGLFSY